MRIVNGRGIKSPADLVGLKPFKDAKLLRHEAIERMKRNMERKLKKRKRRRGLLNHMYAAQMLRHGMDGSVNA